MCVCVCGGGSLKKIRYLQLLWALSFTCIPREGLIPTGCVLCGKDKAAYECRCPSIIGCQACESDIKIRAKNQATFDMHYSCKTHGRYRHYEDSLITYKSWFMVWVVIMILPFGLIIIESGMNLNWVILAGQTFTTPFVVPIVLTITWSRTTGAGVIAGIYVN